MCRKIHAGNIMLVAITVLITCSCGSKRKLEELCNNNIAAGVTIAENMAMEELRDSTLDAAPAEKIAVVDRLGQVYVMEAVKDEELGEMVISDKLEAIVVEAKFRNIAERNGYVDIAFDIRVPKSMQSSDWQVRMTPVVEYLGEKYQLDKIYITGANYRKEQLKGYQLYEKFLKSIIPQDSDFVSTYTHKRLLELFIERNFREIAKLKNDTSQVGANLESELFGITRDQVVDHYTKETLIRRNNRKIANKGKMYAKYVKVPIEESGVRLDSVINNPDSSTIYHYSHTIKARRGLKRVDLVLGGEIYNMEKLIYTMPAVGPLTYYISSLTQFANSSPRYIKRVIERNAVANRVCYIDFRQGEYEVCDTLRNNSGEIAAVKSTIAEIMGDTDYMIDSLVITASCSPEGSYSSNLILAQKRAEAIKGYFVRYIEECAAVSGSGYWELSMDGSEEESVEVPKREIEIGTRWVAEGWEMLTQIMEKDTIITDREHLAETLAIEDPDMREKALLDSPDGVYIKDILYPFLRCVKFDFHLHRRGMIKDTIHTTELDTLYMKGVEALMERDYKSAVTLLRPYRDINSAVAFVCMDYNNSALDILESLPQSAICNYMKSIVYARLGNEQKAVSHFIQSVQDDPSMRHRGNLDPEISGLLKKYNVMEHLENN